MLQFKVLQLLRATSNVLFSIIGVIEVTMFRAVNSEGMFMGRDLEATSSDEAEEDLEADEEDEDFIVDDDKMDEGVEADSDEEDEEEDDDEDDRDGSGSDEEEGGKREKGVGCSTCSRLDALARIIGSVSKITASLMLCVTLSLIADVRGKVSIKEEREFPKLMKERSKAREKLLKLCEQVCNMQKGSCAHDIHVADHIYIYNTLMQRGSLSAQCQSALQ